MQYLKIKKLEKPFNIEITSIASDKSISHRCAIFSLLSNEISYIKNYLTGEDTLNTLNIIEQLGAKVKINGSCVEITPPKVLKEANDILDCGNSGTAIRLFCGFLSSIEGAFILTGDQYLNSRPMCRVTKPLNSIGAKIDGRDNANKAPIFIRGTKELESFTYSSPIDSAQIKTAMILAALRAKGVSKYKESFLTRDHTERMLKGMGAKLENDKDGYINIYPLKHSLKALNMRVPCDPSSGFFFALAAAIIPNAKIVLKNITLNPTRIGAYKVLKQMGVDVEFIEKENIYEPIGDIKVSHNKLNAVTIQNNIPWLIDELPALAIAMSLAKGKSVLKNAKELRVKECDRISVVIENLKKCNISCEEFEDGYHIVGGVLKEASINSRGDHRIAMSFAIAGLVCNMNIHDSSCILTSFPNFTDLLDLLK